MPREDPTAVVPPAVTHAGYCPVCGAALARAETGWVCPRGLDHTRIECDEIVAEKLALRLPMQRPARMGPHTWGWYRTRRVEWALRVMRELNRRLRRVKGGK
jgi:hypothetical protein